jgi:small basic protein
MSRLIRTTPAHIHAARATTVLLPIAAFLSGFVLMFGQTTLQVPPQLAQYVALAVLAGTDSVVGGVRAGIEGKFSSDIFLSGFFLNTVAAVGLAFFGDAIGLQDVYLAAVVLFGWRTLTNISLIRRFFIDRARAAQAARAEAESRPGEALTGTEDILGAQSS